MAQHDRDAPYLPHSSHWGAFAARWQDGRLDTIPHPQDPAPAALLANMAAAPRHASRVGKPLVRRGWLETGPGPTERRGRDAFVALDWPEALDLLAAELARIKATHSAAAVFGGSYGWSSAGRFHHAQSQVHRFLNTCLGGYVRSVNSYSSGAASVILPRVLAPIDAVNRRDATWTGLAEHSDLVVVFGGIPLRNAQVSSGGNSEHVAPGALRRARERGAEFVHISPIRDDLPDAVEARWLPIRPATDTALMLALAHTLVAEGLHDRAFLARHCAGFDTFEDYLCGRSDGQAKDAHWAARICGIDPDEIRGLARRMAARRTLITISYALQRAEHGEQPVWMGVTLAAMLGQIGLPGGGLAVGLGSIGNIGKPPLAVPIPTLPQGRNGVRAFIPVARMADMLLFPGEPYNYNGERLTYPDIRLVYWAGGNPFHHHQDLGRLARAFTRPDTIVVHEPFFTATTRFADFILPSTITLEREDLGAAANDPKLIAMHKVVEPFGSAMDDYDIFAGLAERLGARDAFTEGRSARQWLAHLYETTRAALRERQLEAPDFEGFWRKGELDLPISSEPEILSSFRSNPDRHPLPTPSGRVEITSETIAGFGYDDCPGHPAWMEPAEWLGGDEAARYPLQLVANQPATRLHSQLDFGDCSQNAKIGGRERLRIHPADAARRGIATGDLVRLFNARGSCLAGAWVSEDVRQGVVQLPTGAWYDPQPIEGVGLACAHGNPNAVTRDVGTSRLAQGCAGQLSLVEVERFAQAAPPVRAYEPPRTVSRDAELRAHIARLCG